MSQAGSNAAPDDAKSTRTRSGHATPRARSRASKSPASSIRSLTPPPTPPVEGVTPAAPSPPPSVPQTRPASERNPSPAPSLPQTRPASVRNPSPAPQPTDTADPIPMLDTLLSTMRQTLSTLTTAFDTLAFQTTQLSLLRPALESHHEIQRLKAALVAQDEKLDTMRDFLRETLEGGMREVREGLRGQVEEVLGGPVRESVRAEVERSVMERVKEQIAEKIPPSLIETVQNHKEQLTEVRRSLHNAEARRANALLRSHNINEPITPVLRSNGEVSVFFPKDLAQLFSSNAQVSKQLVLDYDLPVDPESRERNLNKFMGHIGVAFQMVPAVSLNLSLEMT